MQLRQDNLAGDHYSLVGFQTQLKWGEQARVLRKIPGLEQAEFVRFGMVHRNTYINGPTVLHETWQTRTNPSLFFAGQISGVEGYVESAASGLLAGRNAAALVRAEPMRVPRAPGPSAVAYYVAHANPHNTGRRISRSALSRSRGTFGKPKAQDRDLGSATADLTISKKDERRGRYSTNVLCSRRAVSGFEA